MNTNSNRPNGKQGLGADSIEQLVADSFDQHARGTGAGRAGGNLDGVFDRVSQRRSRTRRAALFGSLAVIAVGAAGIFALAGDGASDELAGANGDAPSAPTTGGGFTWECASPLTADDGATVFDGCQIVPMVDDPVWRCVDPVVSGDEDGTVVYQSESCTVVGAYDGLPGIDVTATTVAVPGFGVPCVNDPLMPPATTVLLSLDHLADPELPAGTSPTTTAAPDDPPVTTSAPNCFQISTTTSTISLTGTTSPALLTSPVEQSYTVAPGDNPSRVAARFGVSVEQLQVHNEDTDVMQTFVVGETIRIPPGATIPPEGFTRPVRYVVQAGDSMYGIAMKFGVTLDELVAYNGITNDPSGFLLIPDVTTLDIPPASGEDATAVEVFGTVGAQPVDALVIGDSVVQGASTELSTRGYVVIAEEGWQLRDAITPLEGLKSTGQLDHTTVVVIHLGTSGTIDETDLNALLDALSDVPQVLLFTIHADRSWTTANNELIRAADQPADNIVVIDWATLANECNADCLHEDGVHLTENGVQYYANLMTDWTGL